MTTTTNDTRALDAKLHEMRTGEKCWHVVGTTLMSLPDGDTWVEDDWATNKPYGLVPHYTTDANAIRAAEAALPVALQGEYARELDAAISNNRLMTGDGISAEEWDIDYKVLYALITATPAQRAAALVSVLERVKEAK